jgi:hypothetical protein
VNLRYPWWDRWQSLRRRDLHQSKAESALQIAADFIEEYAFEAEQDGWQPIHILKPYTGLAWRWPYLPAISTRPKIMAATISPFDFTYRAERDGSISFITGSRRHKTLMTFGLPGEYSQ